MSKPSKNAKKTGTQPRTPQERVLVLLPSGKKRLIWRDWA